METQNYLFGHLILADLITAMLFFAVRAIWDIYTAQTKVRSRNEVFEIKKFIEFNWLRYLLSFIAAVGLLYALPEGIAWLMGSNEFTWNTLFSGAIGYAPIELFLFVKKKMKKKGQEYADKI